MQSRECLEKCIQTMLVLADAEQCPAYFALTGAAMQDVAMEMLRLRQALGAHRLKLLRANEASLTNDHCLQASEMEARAQEQAGQRVLLLRAK